MNCTSKTSPTAWHPSLPNQPGCCSIHCASETSQTTCTPALPKLWTATSMADLTATFQATCASLALAKQWSVVSAAHLGRRRQHAHLTRHPLRLALAFSSRRLRRHARVSASSQPGNAWPGEVALADPGAEQRVGGGLPHLNYATVAVLARPLPQSTHQPNPASRTQSADRRAAYLQRALPHAQLFSIARNALQFAHVRPRLWGAGSSDVKDPLAELAPQAAEPTHGQR